MCVVRASVLLSEPKIEFAVEIFEVIDQNIWVLNSGYFLSFHDHPSTVTHRTGVSIEMTVYMTGLLLAFVINNFDRHSPSYFLPPFDCPMYRTGAQSAGRKLNIFSAIQNVKTAAESSCAMVSIGPTQ